MRIRGADILLVCSLCFLTILVFLIKKTDQREKALNSAVPSLSAVEIVIDPLLLADQRFEEGSEDLPTSTVPLIRKQRRTLTPRVVDPAAKPSNSAPASQSSGRSAGPDITAPSFILISVARPSLECQLIKLSARRFGVTLRFTRYFYMYKGMRDLRPMHDPSVDFRRRLEVLLNEVSSSRHKPTDVAAIVDPDDAVVVATAEDILAAFSQSGCDIVVAATTNCGPFCLDQSKYGIRHTSNLTSGAGPMYFPDSSVMVGHIRALVSFLNASREFVKLKPKYFGDSAPEDVLIANLIIAARIDPHAMKVCVDAGSTLVHVVRDTQSASALSINSEAKEEPRYFNERTSTFPSFLHCPSNRTLCYNHLQALRE